jgi:hypothetical protein
MRHPVSEPEAHTEAMDEVEHLQAVRLQRRTTDAAIRQTEAWAKAHRAAHRTAFTDMLALYVHSLSVNTVDELADMRGKLMPTSSDFSTCRPEHPKCSG